LRHQRRLSHQIATTTLFGEVDGVDTRGHRVGQEIRHPLVTGELDQAFRQVLGAGAEGPRMAKAHPGELHRFLVSPCRCRTRRGEPRTIATAGRGHRPPGPIPVHRAGPDQLVVSGLLHRRCDRRVRLGALVGGRMGDDRVANQGVHEREPGGPMQQHPCPDPDGDVVGDLRDRLPRGGGKQGRREALGQQRGGGEGTAGLLRQPKERRDQDPPQPAAFGDEPVQTPRAGQGSLGGQSPDVERVAVGAVHEVGGQVKPPSRLLVG
jgi:hypothetical protein